MSQERDNRIWTLAYKLAKSGEFSNWSGVEVELRIQGYSRARQLLDDEQTRDKLDRMCADARKGHPDA